MARKGCVAALGLFLVVDSRGMSYAESGFKIGHGKAARTPWTFLRAPSEPMAGSVSKGTGPFFVLKQSKKKCCEKRCEISGETGGILRKAGEGLKCLSPNVHAVLLRFSGSYDGGALQFSRLARSAAPSPLHPLFDQT